MVIFLSLLFIFWLISKAMKSKSNQFIAKKGGGMLLRMFLKR